MLHSDQAESDQVSKFVCRVVSGYLVANVVALTAAISACTKGRNWQSAIALLLVQGMCYIRAEAE